MIASGKGDSGGRGAGEGGRQGEARGEGGGKGGGGEGEECRELLASLCRAVAAIAVAVPYLATPVSGRC